LNLIISVAAFVVMPIISSKNIPKEKEMVSRNIYWNSNCSPAEMEAQINDFGSK
jgi:hypothetical protein